MCVKIVLYPCLDLIILDITLSWKPELYTINILGVISSHAQITGARRQDPHMVPHVLVPPTNLFSFMQFFSTSKKSAFNFPDFSFVILGIFYCFRQNSEHLERPLEVALTPLPSFLLASIKMSYISLGKYMGILTNRFSDTSGSTDVYIGRR
jgi:hypothetical protein